MLCVLDAVAWLSRIPRCATLSTSEEECVEIGDCIKESLSVVGVLKFLLQQIAEECVRVFEGNEGRYKWHRVLEVRLRQGTVICATTPSEHLHTKELC